VRGKKKPKGFEGSLAGWKPTLKAVWLEIFGPVLRGFRPDIDPGTLVDRPGPPRTSKSTKNQPRRPILRPVRDAQKIPPYIQAGSVPGGSSGETLVRGQKKPKTQIFDLFLPFWASGLA